jgi:uncharacterized protein (TIGR02145 family)
LFHNKKHLKNIKHMKKILFITAIIGLLFASCVNKDKSISVENVKLDETSATLQVGNTLTLTTTITPDNATNKAVAWTSSNNSVATVDSNGLVIAKTEGTATITVTTIDGDKKASCVLTSTNDILVLGLGTISFATDSIWTIGSQIWSDAVQTTICSRKTSFNGRIDCRSNPNQKGDLFSWSAVNHFKSQICPAPWRVPTDDDFVNLDRALGGNGKSRDNDIETLLKYMGSNWGGSFSGLSFSDGTLAWQGTRVIYWTQQSFSNNTAFTLYLDSSGGINPWNTNDRNAGFSVRCVRDNN